MNLMVDCNVRRENYVANKYAMNEYTAEPRKSHTGQLNKTRTRESNETRVSTPGVQRDTTPSRSRKPQQKQQQQQHSVGCMMLRTTRSLTTSYTHTHTLFHISLSSEERCLRYAPVTNKQYVIYCSSSHAKQNHSR